VNTFDPYDFRFSRVGAILYRTYFKCKLLLIFIAVGEVMKPLLRKLRLIKRHSYPLVDAFSLRRKLLNEPLSLDEINRIISMGRIWNGTLGYGLNRRLPISKDVDYTEDAVFTTVTIYIYRLLTENFYFSSSNTRCVEDIELFFIQGIEFESINNRLYCSYSNKNDRYVLNALAYVLSAYDDMRFRRSRLYLKYESLLDERINKMLETLIFHQRSDGSVPYSIEENSFVDCLHSAFIIESLIQSKTIQKERYELFVENALDYLMENHYDNNLNLYLRYPRHYKGLKGFLNRIQVSLYDNVEMYNVLNLVNRRNQAIELRSNIDRVFLDNYTLFNSYGISFCYGRDYLRWGIIQKLYYYELHK
jgi:hypothetical protein